MCDELKIFAKLLDTSAMLQEAPERKKIIQAATEDMKRKAEGRKA